MNSVLQIHWPFLKDRVKLIVLKYQEIKPVPCSQRLPKRVQPFSSKIDSCTTGILTITWTIQEHWLLKTWTASWEKAQASGTYWLGRRVLYGASQYWRERRIEAAALDLGRFGRPFNCFDVSLTRPSGCTGKNHSPCRSVPLSRESPRSRLFRF